MLYREIMTVCSEIHTKHINKLCGQNVELLNVKLEVHIVTTGLQRVKFSHYWCGDDRPWPTQPNLPNPQADTHNTCYHRHNRLPSKHPVSSVIMFVLSTLPYGSTSLTIRHKSYFIFHSVWSLNPTNKQNVKNSDLTTSVNKWYPYIQRALCVSEWVTIRCHF